MTLAQPNPLRPFLEGDVGGMILMIAGLVVIIGFFVWKDRRAKRSGKS